MYVVGVGPLGAVCGVRVLRNLATSTGHWAGRVAAARFDLALGAAAIGATILAWAANNVITALGGYRVNRLPFYLVRWQRLPHNAPAAWKVLQVFGADFAGLHGIWLGLAFLHLASVLLVGWALARVARRFFRVSLADQVLAAAIVLNVVLYLVTNAAGEAAHEVAVIVPFGAALAARVLIPAFTAETGKLRAGRARVAALVTGAVVLAGTPPGSATSSPGPRSRPPTSAWRRGCSSIISLTGSAATGRAAASPWTAASGSASGP